MTDGALTALKPDIEALIAELGRLWRIYSGAFQSGDMKAILPMFDVPLSIITRQETRVFHDLDNLLANNEALIGFYRHHKVARVEATITDVEPFHRHFAQVQINYILLDAAQQPVVTFATIYGLKQRDSRWLIHSIIAQDEMDAWRRIGAPLAGASSTIPRSAVHILCTSDRGRV